MKRKIIKLILTLTIAMISYAVSGLTCFAVPAMPGSSCGGDSLCHSETAETMVTMDVLAERDRLKEEKAIKNGSIAGEMVAGITKGDTERSLPFLCIVVGFNGTTADAPKGMQYSEQYDWGEYIFRSEKSLTRYYKDMSLGKFTFVPAAENSRYGYGGNKNKPDKVNDGIIHVTIDQPHLDWSVQEKIDDTEMYKVLTEAVEKSSAYVDLGQYDADGDGMIANSELAVCFILAGYDSSMEPYEQSMGSMNYVWPHAYSFKAMKNKVSGFTYPDIHGVKLDKYICTAESMIYDDEAEQTWLSTMFHELGHYLGLCDLYNTINVADGEWQDYKIGIMSLMDSGCWGVDEYGDITAYSLDMWSRYALGWIEAEKITESGTYTISGDDYSVKTKYPRLYYISGSKKNEYYLIENHRMSGWDSGLYMALYNQLGRDMGYRDGGIVIWHIDDDINKAYLSTNMVNAVFHRPGVMPLYPEKASDPKGNLNFTLISDINKGTVFRDPFYVAKKANKEKCTLTLPSYGWGNVADLRRGRFDSFTEISFESSSGNEMQIKVSVKSNEWVRRNNKWMYIGEAGQIMTGWQKISGKWYYLNDNGIMLTGWLKTGGKWYYLTGSGAMKTGWLLSDGKWYFLTSSGAMKTGWLKTGGEWYYLTGSGAMKTGWQKSSGKWYYLSSSGAMVTGSCTIDGKTYRFAESGECLNP